MKFCHFKLLLPQGQQPLIKVRLDKKGLLILLFGYRIFFSDPVISHLKLGCHYIFCSRFIQRNAANHPSPLPWTQGPPKLQLSPLELPSLFFQTLYLQCPALNHLVKLEPLSSPSSPSLSGGLFSVNTLS
ncbi:unnamed protein product, partial [Vitis vinifera]